MTLIELLVVVIILAILGTAVLGVAQAAMEAAKAARTRSTIAKLHTLLTERHASYETRPIEFNSAVRGFLNSLPRNATRGKIQLDLQLLARRELMKLEMPDRWSDVIGAPIGGTLQNPALVAMPALASNYWRRLETLYNNANAISGELNTSDEIARFQGAECLYLTIMLATGDGEARTFFNEQDIGDVDGDGAQEFLDGWGRPISYLRWPAGFVDQSDLMTGDGDNDHDPFDPFRRDQIGIVEPDQSMYVWQRTSWRPFVQLIRDRNNNLQISAYRLAPLIYSGGPDEQTGIFTGLDDYVSVLDPYGLYPANAGIEQRIGAVLINDDGELTADAVDNLHNHLMEY
ncbi:MAG: prepilin-type N-terminal cleavage/methylation domain-containing protein [Planctomycetota bacterium]